MYMMKMLELSSFVLYKHCMLYDFTMFLAYMSAAKSSGTVWHPTYIHCNNKPIKIMLII